MRLLIDTSSIQFRVSSAARPRPDFKDKERQATSRDGQPIWTVRLDAIDAERETCRLTPAPAPARTPSTTA
jgi:hypothetical protein